MEVLVGNRIRSLTALSPDLAENEPDRSSGSNDGLQTLKQVLDSVRKYRRLIVTMTVMGTLLVTVLSLVMPPSYLATAQLAVDVRQAGAAGARGATGVSPALTASAEEAIIDTHVTVLLSDAYLRRLLPAFSALEDVRNSERTEAQTWAQRLRTLVG